MIYTFNQGFNFSLPPAVGNGSGVSLYKSPKLSLSLIDKFGLTVNSTNQYSNQNSLYYNVDVKYPNGSFAPNGGQNFETGLKNPYYTFTYEKNTGVFNGSPQRSYDLVFKLNEVSPATTSSGIYSIYHNEAQISGVTSVNDGTIISGNPNKTGQIDINLSMSGNNYYRVKKFEIYSGNASNFTVVTGTGAGANLLKSISVFDQKTNYTLTINDGEQQFDGNYYFYKILPYDDFGSGVLYTSPTSGTMYSVVAPAFRVDTLTGKGVVLVNSGAYAITTYHSGEITGTGYNVVDRVLNVSGNIVSGGWYNTSAVGDFDQSITQYFKTIKYLAQTIDGTGNVSSREILITDNSTSQTGVSRTGILYSEYAVSDNNQSAQFLVSGSGYSNGSGSILLMSRVNYPTGYYKLLRTVL